MEDEKDKTQDQSVEELQKKLCEVQVVETRMADPPRDFGGACCSHDVIQLAKGFFRDASSAFIIVGISADMRLIRMERFRSDTGGVPTLVRAGVSIGAPSALLLHYLPTIGPKVTKEMIDAERDGAVRAVRAFFFAGVQLLDYVLLGPYAGSGDSREGERGYYSFSSKSKRFNRVRQETIDETNGRVIRNKRGIEISGRGAKMTGAVIVGPGGKSKKLDLDNENDKGLLEALLGLSKDEEDDDEEKKKGKKDEEDEDIFN